MSNGELLAKIEQLRHKLIELSNKEVDYKEVLRVSRELDTYIAQYQKNTMQR